MRRAVGLLFAGLLGGCIFLTRFDDPQHCDDRAPVGEECLPGFHCVAGLCVDGGVERTADAGSADAAMADAGGPDASIPDAGTTDGGADAGHSDGGTDAGHTDGGTDAGHTDAGKADGG